MDRILESLSKIVADAAREAAEVAVAQKFEAALDARNTAVAALEKAGETQAKLDAALSLANTLNVASEQRIVATADMVLAGNITCQETWSPTFVQQAAHQVSTVINRLSTLPGGNIPEGTYGVVICLYRQGKKR